MAEDVACITTKQRTRDFHRIMNDALSLAVLTSLYEAGELEAEALADALMRDPAELRELIASLSSVGLLAERHERFRRYYRLADALPAWVVIALGTACSQRVAANS
ncbi:MAG: hypothetical protein RI539_07490 [Spiribacter sp.]|jgi:DNA-binding transcriptional ArsR family regulator|nr:hypothetical protein [Spiribacter sp.]MDR9490166.1 hypothetical protein [Spiribacter sp.]